MVRGVVSSDRCGELYERFEGIVRLPISGFLGVF